ncbi:MAG: type IV toxin-antitoxin system AbiEi family antitoxin domain-containing protein [Methanomassiliicoccaceae archaeon]|nr:type IV toxin-antitoxin system AbiEi family antitoxin domain-containing protein [Methanomassiliicoccaceae archaeon]
MNDATVNAQGYGEHIRALIHDWPVGKPITTSAAAANLADAFGIDMKNARKITNVNIKRLSDKGELVRVQKGVYGNVKVTPFGKLTPSTDEVMTALLLRDDDKTIGHIAGPTLLNAVGLCTWIPKERHIVTNGFRRRIPDGTPIRVHKPIIPVNDENVLYLQAIEAFNAMDRYPIDADRPDDILREMLRRNNIDNEKLIWYARKHYGQKTLLRTIDIAIGEIEQ